METETLGLPYLGLKGVRFLAHPHEIMKIQNAQKMQKFAELIVQECIHTVESHGGMGGAVAGDKIRKHFGVKS